MLENMFANHPSLLIPVIAIGGSLFVAMFSMVMCTVKTVTKTKEKERSRREIAAYIAEGSISADEGERLLNAGKKA